VPTAPASFGVTKAPTALASLSSSCNASFGAIYSATLRSSDQGTGNMTLHNGGLSQSFSVTVLRRNPFGQFCQDITEPVTWFPWNAGGPFPYGWQHYVIIVNQVTQAMTLRGIATTPYNASCGCYLYGGWAAQLTNYPSFFMAGGVQVVP
jgi:hypothetical protein